MTIENVLNKTAEIAKTIDVSEPLGNRVWVHPYDIEDLDDTIFPFAVVSKLEVGEGEWSMQAAGSGRHSWDVILAVYLSQGPLLPTSASSESIRVLKVKDEWYQALADTLTSNLTLGGSVDIIGDDENLFSYITDNIVWDENQYFGHLFRIPVTQTVPQSTSS